jgi:phospholipid/cholesterol/gamma-HCH transport system substrate-binding protein
MEYTRRRGLEIALGIGLSLALVLTVVLVYKSFSGDFSDDITVSAQISQAGDALEQGDIVTYRDLIVGQVTTASGSLDGSALLRLKIHRSNADVIPADVSAVAVPASLFGSTKVMLVPPTDTSGPTLRGGMRIAADTSPAAQSLQTALANAYQLLTAVHPAQLDAALSALASALQGQGENLGTLIETADAYLRKLAPSLPALNEVITSLATVSDELAKNAPALLGSLGSLLTVAKGIQTSKQSVARLMAIAPTAVDNAQLLLSPNNVNNTVTILRNEGPVIDAFGADPNALPATINGFKSFADTFSGALASGPYLKVNIILTGANLAALFNIAVGQQGTVFKSVSDPPGYTSAECPRYAGSSGPNCGGALAPSDASSTILTTGSETGSPDATVGSSREVQVVRGAASAITGVPASQIPDFADLMIGPLLRGVPTVIQP